MNVKEYKIWRFCYESYEETVKLPEDMKLYSENKADSLIQFEKDKADPFYKEGTIKYPNQRWLGLYPYSVEAWKLLNGKNAMAMDIFNLCNEWIIVYFDQISPLCEDWSETKERPRLPHPYYVKLRAMKVEYNSKKLLDRIDEVSKLGISDDEQNRILKEEFCPISKYIKIHDFSGCDFFDTTTIVNADLAFGDPIYTIYRENHAFNNILDAFHLEKTEFSNEEEFNLAYNKKVKEILG